ncbi:MAG TPA: DUF4230 domain-containing protein [Desulfobacteraceae bacterium]|nr:DUF4230 domain-containing protein [Desulfobacteraceae bacterium]HPJ66288.1 DUF4230 domain-containing protein [Desulfobacteraceae bacterium]HPQ29962.1 DUF4230 domain-containing protein [Desulfobacteraceae bacterium]
MESFISGLSGFVLAAIIFAVLWFKKLRKSPPKMSFDIYSTIDKFRSVGELVVFKIITKEIITASDHWFGETGKKYFRWLASNKKMAMIFQFEIDFKYNLHSPDFVIENIGENNYRLKMPQCLYESNIKDIKIYDEQGAKLLPWLLPHLITDALSDGFTEDTKNQLISEAKSQASHMAHDLVSKIQSEVHKSAIQTLEVLAKGFGAERIKVEFSDAELVQTEVKYLSLDKKEGKELREDDIQMERH